MTEIVTGKQVLEEERDTWKARAEAAENDLRELRENTLLTLGLNLVDVADGMEDQSISYLLNGWKERIAEMEAQLAAQAWRPVTGDDLPEDHDEALVTVENDDGYRFVDMAEFTVGGVWWQRVDTGWQELKRVTHWRPLPPPPAATE